MAVKEDKGTEGLLTKIHEAQKETNKLLKNHIEALREQNKKLELLTVGLGSSGSIKPKTDITPLIELQRETNKLIKKLVGSAKTEANEMKTKKSYTQPPIRPLEY